MTQQRRTINGLLEKFKGNAGRKFLQEQVRKVKEHEASCIINGGIRRQLEYLLNRLHQQQLERLCHNFLSEQKALKELATKLQSRRRLADLVRCLYHQKACEADSLAMNAVTEQLKYLLRIVGSVPRLEELLRQM